MPEARTWAWLGIEVGESSTVGTCAIFAYLKYALGSSVPDQRSISECTMQHARNDRFFRLQRSVWP